MSATHPVLEAAYAIDRDDQAWVVGITRAIGGFFKLDCSGYVIDLDASPKDRITAVVKGDIFTERYVDGALDMHRAAPLETLRVLYPSSPFANHWAEHYPTMRDVPEASDWLRAMDSMRLSAGIPNMFGVYGGSSCGGCMLVLPITKSASARRRWALRRIAVHVAAAYRLRKHGLPPPDALVDEDGNILEREIDLREAAPRVRSAVQATKRAQTASEALDVWQGLVDGRWSLLRTTERDGRRHLVLRRNELEETRGDDEQSRRISQVLALGARGHSNKFIAYELGLPIATVASDMRRGLAKLGLTRAELVRATAPGAPR